MTAVRDDDLVLQMPLSGMRLIEASAGTGKTHTLVLLLLRAMLVERCEPRELMAVTYTRAAAGELRERTRIVLAHAARRAGDPEIDIPDHLLAPIDAMIETALARPDAESRPILARRLRAAELAIDTLWLGTIHAICQRLLSEFGPMLGMPDIGDEVDAGKELFALACADTWRALQSDRDLPGFAAALPETPEKLAKLLEPIIAMPSSALFPPSPPDATELHALRSAYEAVWHRARTAASDAGVLLDAIADRKRYWITEKGVPDKVITRSARLIARYFSSEPGSIRIPDEFSTLTAENLADSVHKKHKNADPLPAHPLPLVLPALIEAETAWRDALRVSVMHRLHADVRARLARIGFEQARVRFDDLVSQVADLLAAPEGGKLITLARARWRLAFIDEFQDTDAEQYAIFSTLFGDRMVMVGDPKQAIYRFRGGDVHAYRRASRDADGIARLSISRRAEQPVIDAVNALFDDARLEHPFREAFIGYEPVACGFDAARHGELVVVGQPAAGMCVWPIRNESGDIWPNKDEPRKQILAAVGQEIVDLLHSNRRGQLVFPNGDHRDLTAGDIAVLCQTKAECAAVAAELRRRRLPVSLADDPDIERLAGEDIRRLLAAWLAPQDGGRLRALALSGFYGLTLDLLSDGIEGDGALSVEQLAAFLRQAHWANDRELGRAMTDVIRQGTAATKALVDGEMRLDAWLRMSDRILQWALPGQGLNSIYLRFVRWLENRQTETDSSAAPESSDAIRVMTIHASKGLEFGVVFVPFQWTQRDPAYRRSNAGLVAARFHDEEGLLRVDVGSNAFETHQQVADEEERAEGIRKTYVAVTRARHRVYLPVAVTKNGWAESPLAHLLPDINPAMGVDLNASLQAFARCAPGSIEITVPPVFSDVPVTSSAARGLPSAPKPVRAPRTDFRLMSYSRLTRMIGDETRDLDQISIIDSMPASMDASDDGRPRGAAFGTCFHTLMESAVIGELDAEVLMRIAQAHGFAAPRERSYLERLVASTLNAGLPGGRSLRDLTTTDCRVEMEFFLPMRAFSVRSLGETLAMHESYRRPQERWPALPNVVQGYLRGFIDLVYRVGDGYYVLDYKTNDLGIGASAYTDELLRSSILAHDYDLQYLIYLVALQRLLRQRLGNDYVPEHHLGGAVYLFVRGLELGGGMHFDRPPQDLIDRLESVLCGDRP